MVSKKKDIIQNIPQDKKIKSTEEEPLTFTIDTDEMGTIPSYDEDIVPIRPISENTAPSEIFLSREEEDAQRAIDEEEAESKKESQRIADKAKSDMDEGVKALRKFNAERDEAQSIADKAQSDMDEGAEALKKFNAEKEESQRIADKAQSDMDEGAEALKKFNESKNIKSTNDKLSQPLKNERSKWDTFTNNMLGRTDQNELGLARKGGYYGQDKGTLQNEIVSLTNENKEHRKRIIEINQQMNRLESEKSDIDEIPYHKRNDETNARLSQIKRDLKTLSTEKAQLVSQMSENNSTINKNVSNISNYNQAVEKGKLSSTGSSRISGIRRTLSEIGKNAGDVKSGTEGMNKKDWFGKTGFLDRPKVATTMPIEPVKGGSSRLSGYTRLTGSSVQGGLGTALTHVNASKIINPFGVSGTVAGSKQQFLHTIPARQIPLSSLNKANINRAILPNIYDVKPVVQAAPPVEYKQIIQPDGSVTNIPVQQSASRKSKVMKVSVNRYSTNNIKLNVPNKSNRNAMLVIPNKSTKRDTMISRGIGSVGNVKTISMIQSSEIKTPRSLKPMVSVSDRSNLSLNLINTKHMGLNLSQDSDNSSKLKIESPTYRKPKKVSAVNLDVSKQITKNINNIISKQKRK